MRRTLVLLGSPAVDQAPATRRWIRERVATELLAMSSADRVIATAPLDFVRFTVGPAGPAFVFLHPTGAILIDGRDTGQQWVGDLGVLIRGYAEREPPVKVLSFVLPGHDAPDVRDLDATVLVWKEPT